MDAIGTRTTIWRTCEIKNVKLLVLTETLEFYNILSHS